MYDDDYFNPVHENDVEKIFEKTKILDKGYNTVYRKAQRKDGKTYNKKIAVYTSSGIGSRIRDAETGEYYSNIVGTKDEDLFFKVMLATGECNSTNGSFSLFYASPQHYSNHLLCDIDSKIIEDWEKKRDTRLIEINKERNKI